MFNRKKKLGRRTIKQWFIHIVRRLLRKEYCKICGQELTEIRGLYPKEPRRKVCACCATEKLEWIEEQNNVEAKCSNNEVAVCDNCHKNPVLRYDQTTGLDLCSDCYRKAN